LGGYGHCPNNVPTHLCKPALVDLLRRRNKWGSF
jgi:hypothetical protein